MTAPDPRLELKPHHGGISVPDLEASIAWYCDNLGSFWTSSWTSPRTPADWPSSERRLPHRALRGARCGAAPDDRRYVDRDLRTHGMNHIAYLVRDVSSLVADLRANGVDIAWDVREHGGMKAAFVRDNSGNLVELMESAEAR